MKNRFTVQKSSGKARKGIYETIHGAFETPVFMPVGTQATVKGLDAERIKDTGASIVLVNTYHLWLRPGHESVSNLGGIQKFMSWDGPILSDSGGYQVFSLASMRKVTEEGVHFQSHLDGSKKFLTPELSIEIQETLGVDIAMVLDECPPATWDKEAISKSLDMTLRWAKRSLESRKRESLSIFGITQGGKFHDLRTKAAEELSKLPFDGYAIGGVSVGEPKEVMYEVVSTHTKQLPDRQIRYLMGVGTPEDIVHAVREGVDLFDCVMPTRSGRFGRAFVRGDEPTLNLRNARFLTDITPLDETCRCLACRRYSRAYIHHLFRAEEMLGPQLLTLHNLTHYLDLMSSIRSAIGEGSFDRLYEEEKKRWRGKKEEKEPALLREIE